MRSQIEAQPGQLSLVGQWAWAGDVAEQFLNSILITACGKEIKTEIMAFGGK